MRLPGFLAAAPLLALALALPRRAEAFHEGLFFAGVGGRWPAT